MTSGKKIKQEVCFLLVDSEFVIVLLIYNLTLSRENRTSMRLN
jgi:hypothetical protein